MDKNQFRTNDAGYLSEEELEGLAITQQQILNAYNDGTSDGIFSLDRTKAPRSTAERTDEDS